MYLAMVLGMAELSSALPAAGGGYTFARRALGPWGGFATGTAILIEYAIAPAAIATFIGAYVESLGLFGITDGWWVYLAAYALFIGIHLSGAGEALKVMFVVTAVALVGLVVFVIGAIPLFDAANLVDIPPTDAVGRVGVPAVRRCSASGRRCRSRSGSSWPSRACRWPRRRRATRRATCPAGIVVSMLVLVVTGAACWCSPPARSARRPSRSRGTRWSRRSATGALAAVVNYIGLAGLVASFFSIIYAYSRQTFALSRAGYLPRVLSVTNGRKAPDAGPDRARRRSASCCR